MGGGGRLAGLSSDILEAVMDPSEFGNLISAHSHPHIPNTWYQALYMGGKECHNPWPSEDSSPSASLERLVTCVWLLIHWPLINQYCKNRRWGINWLTRPWVPGSGAHQLSPHALWMQHCSKTIVRLTTQITVIVAILILIHLNFVTYILLTALEFTVRK